MKQVRIELANLMAIPSLLCYQKSKSRLSLSRGKEAILKKRGVRSHLIHWPTSIYLAQLQWMLYLDPTHVWAPLTTTMNATINLQCASYGQVGRPDAVESHGERL
ncbi:hypothetical protein ACOSP7_004574 [Xanthoceras sorbifolium]